MQNLLGTHWHNHTQTHTHTRTRNSTPARTRIRIRTRVVLVSYSRVVSRLHVVYISSIYIFLCCCCCVVSSYYLLFVYVVLCCSLFFTSLHTTQSHCSYLSLFVFYFIFCSALRCVRVRVCVPFRAGQLNSTTFDLRMFDQLLLLLLLLPGDVIVCASGCG